MPYVCHGEESVWSCELVYFRRRLRGRTQPLGVESNEIRSRSGYSATSLLRRMESPMWSSHFMPRARRVVAIM